MSEGEVAPDQPLYTQEQIAEMDEAELARMRDDALGCNISVCSRFRKQLHIKPSMRLPHSGGERDRHYLCTLFNMVASMSARVCGQTFGLLVHEIVIDMSQNCILVIVYGRFQNRPQTI